MNNTLSTHFTVKEETTAVGAAQIMVGVMHCTLGYLWLYLYIQQFYVFSLVYQPIVLLSGYPILASIFFITSGALAIRVQKKPSPSLLTCTIRMNVNSLIFATLGLFLVVLEVTLFLAQGERVEWPHQSGMMLSAYLWIFSSAEMLLAEKAARWGKQALRRGTRHA